MKLKKRLKSEKRNSQSKILAAVSLALVSALTFMTVGFAAYDQILTISGAVKVSAPGSIHISNVTYLNGTDVYSASQGTGSQPQPSHDDETIDYDLAFTNVSAGSAFAEYRVTIANDSYEDRQFDIQAFNPNIVNATGEALSATVLSEFSGLPNGNIVLAGEEIFFTVRLSINADVDDDHIIVGDMVIDFSGSNEAMLSAAISGSSNGNLKGNRNTAGAAFKIKVTNSYDYSQSFSVVIRGNDQLYLSAADNATLESFTIPANSTQTYTVYAHYYEGSTFTSNKITASLVVVPNFGVEIECGSIRLNVDKK